MWVLRRLKMAPVLHASLLCCWELRGIPTCCATEKVFTHESLVPPPSGKHMWSDVVPQVPWSTSPSSIYVHLTLGIRVVPSSPLAWLGGCELWYPLVPLMVPMCSTNGACMLLNWSPCVLLLCAVQAAIQHYEDIKIFPDMFREVLLDKVRITSWEPRC